MTNRTGCGRCAPSPTRSWKARLGTVGKQRYVARYYHFVGACCCVSACLHLRVCFSVSISSLCVWNCVSCLPRCVRECVCGCSGSCGLIVQHRFPLLASRVTGYMHSLPCAHIHISTQQATPMVAVGCYGGSISVYSLNLSLVYGLHGMRVCGVCGVCGCTWHVGWRIRSVPSSLLIVDCSFSHHLPPNPNR